jgi:DNA-3-methyladenine glycosylase
VTVLPRSFYDRDTVEVARELLGKFLVREDGEAPRVGRIVEVEAYVGPEDLACHSSKGMTPRNRSMFGPPGHAYVYRVYGMHWCLNAVTEAEGHASAVLLRALEPVSNVDGPTNGPGRLCKAMGIDGRLDAHDLTAPGLRIASGDGSAPSRIVRRPRVGVDYAGPSWAGRLLRFYLRGNPFVSRP